MEERWNRRDAATRYCKVGWGMTTTRAARYSRRPVMVTEARIGGNPQPLCLVLDVSLAAMAVQALRDIAQGR